MTTCPYCGRQMFQPNPQDPVPTRHDPYILPPLPPKFRLPADHGNLPVQVVSITNHDETGTTTITVRQLLS